MDNLIRVSPELVIGLLAGAVALIVLLGGALVWLLRQGAGMVRQKFARVEEYGKKQAEFFEATAKAQQDFFQDQLKAHQQLVQAQSEKDSLLVERVSMLTERLKVTEQSMALLPDRLREGSQTMRGLKEELEADKAEKHEFEQEVLARQAKFEQEVHARELGFANQWQTTLVNLADRFVSKESLEDYRARHEQDHSRLEQRMAHQEHMSEQMTANILGIEKKLEGGIHTIASLLAKHITVGNSKDDEPCKPDDDQG